MLVYRSVTHPTGATWNKIPHDDMKHWILISSWRGWTRMAQKKYINRVINRLVGGFHPISQIGNLPQIGVKIKNMWKHRSYRTHRIWNHHLAGLGSLCSYDQKNTIWGEANLVLSKRCWNHHHLNWYRLILGGTKSPKICYGFKKGPYYKWSCFYPITPFSMAKKKWVTGFFIPMNRVSQLEEIQSTSVPSSVHLNTSILTESGQLLHHG